MVPAHISIFIHYAVCVNPYPAETALNKEYCDEALSDLIKQGLFSREVVNNRNSCETRIKLTDKGKCYLNALTKLPLPEMKWEIPS